MRGGGDGGGFLTGGGFLAGGGDFFTAGGGDFLTTGGGGERGGGTPQQSCEMVVVGTLWTVHANCEASPVLQGEGGTGAGKKEKGDGRQRGKGRGVQTKIKIQGAQLREGKAAQSMAAGIERIRASCPHLDITPTAEPHARELLSSAVKTK